MFDRPFIAIDIGTSSIKLVELSGRQRRQLRALGLETLPPETIVDGMIVNQPQVEATLRKLLKKLKIQPKGRKAALSLGGSSVIVKTVQVQAADQDQINDQIIYEAEQNFQANLEEIYFDYVVQGQVSDNEYTVMMVGAKRDLVEQNITTAKNVGLRVGIIECDVFSVANMFEYNYGVVNGLTAIINIGASVSQVSLLSSGEFVYTRDIPLAGDEYSRQIMHAMSIDMQNADTLKIAASQGDVSIPDEIVGVLGNLNEQMVSEIQMTIDFYFQSALSHSDTSLSSVYLTGGGSRVLGLDAAIAANLEVPVQIMNPFQNVDINPKKFQMDYILLQGHLYGVASGLGMRVREEIAA